MRLGVGSGRDDAFMNQDTWAASDDIESVGRSLGKADLDASTLVEEHRDDAVIEGDIALGTQRGELPHMRTAKGKTEKIAAAVQYPILTVSGPFWLRVTGRDLADLYWLSRLLMGACFLRRYAKLAQPFCLRWR
jgi:hypothetical protein